MKTRYRYVGTTYDGVRVIAPKTKSKRFTRAEVRKAIREALRVGTATLKPHRRGRPPIARSGKRCASFDHSRPDRVFRRKDLL